jgi:ubiquinone biosynthesis monooxygenase Coq7
MLTVREITLPTREALTVSRIVKVNHAGEYGAIRIYSAQIAVARRLYPDVVATLSDMLEHEKRHCAAFQSAMPDRNSRPCRMMGLWSSGGWLLGFLTALIGRRGIWTCTAAVEAAVHRHLEDQLHFLRSRDVALYGIIHEIQDEELSHLSHAEAQIPDPSAAQQWLRRLISDTTDVVIWLSTWGDSSRMARELHHARQTNN